MADTPTTTLNFTKGCGDCAVRETALPPPLPDVGDDFDWAVRGYDGFRIFMMEALMARFPDRTRWTPADMEVVLVELFAGALDQLSDMLDRVHGEAFLETARRPESVRRLLAMIGYDALRESGMPYDPPVNLNDPEDRLEAITQLERYWRNYPQAMNRARKTGPEAIRTQHRMVTEQDYGDRLALHPLVRRAGARSRWTGSWNTIFASVVLTDNQDLDEYLGEGTDTAAPILDNLRDQTDSFHHRLGLPPVLWEAQPAFRAILNEYIERYRMTGQEVFLQNAVFVGIYLALSVRVAEGYYQSEIRRSVLEVLGIGPGGFFEPGRLAFGEDLFLGDLFETVTALAGVEAVCINRFKRLGRRYADQSDSGRIALKDMEIAVCDNDPEAPDRGYISLRVNGGITG